VIPNLKVRDVMTPNPVTVSPEESLMEALQLMRLRKIRRIPVVSGDRLVGLLTEGDLKRAEPSTLSDTQENFNAVMEGTQVNRIMIENLVTTSPDSPVIEAARILFRSRYGAFSVSTGTPRV